MIMVVMMLITMLPSTVFASWAEPAQTVNLSVGEKITNPSYGDPDTIAFYYEGDDGSTYRVMSYVGTVPDGIVVQYGGLSGEPQIIGTPTAGTVGTHVLTFTDSTDSSTLQVTINISKGEQTICVDDGTTTDVSAISIPVGTAYTLDTYSTDANGNKIDVSVVDTDLVADHQPTNLHLHKFRYECCHCK